MIPTRWCFRIKMEAQYDPISIPQNDLEESLNFVVVDIGISVNKSSPFWQDDIYKKSLSYYGGRGGGGGGVPSKENSMEIINIFFEPYPSALLKKWGQWRPLHTFGQCRTWLWCWQWWTLYGCELGWLDHLSPGQRGRICHLIFFWILIGVVGYLFSFLVG